MSYVTDAGGTGGDERIYAQVGTLDSSQPLTNQIFYNTQFDVDTLGKIPRKEYQHLFYYDN